MRLEHLGERKAIKMISGITKTDVSDDCAILPFGKSYLLFTTDMINEYTHIPENSKPYWIGWHVVAINLSDIAAKGGKPLGVSVALGLPENYDAKFLKELSKGMGDCAKKYSTKIVGGDTKENKTLTLCGSAIGVVNRKNIMLRKGAKPGDVVCVTGTLGTSSAGLHSKNPKKVLMINPRVKEGIALAETNAVTSCMDISDGVASSIYQLSSLNKAGFEIDYELLPVNRSTKNVRRKLKIPLEELCLYSGGDYELLLTVKKNRLRDVVNKLKNI
ncbi:MAG: thiamine-phosphate kinase, partial [Candidatus Thermoplasmatota archaeon]|nr:thiamine-phosphate kinase [Candidatus Thermoplasmatota archaeon]